MPSPHPTEAAASHGRRRLLLILRLMLGVAVLAFGLLFLNLSIRVIYLWLARDSFVPATLVVEKFHPRVNDEAVVVGRVDPPGTEIALKKLPFDFHVFSSPSAITSTYITPEQAVGRAYPIWFNVSTDALADDDQMEYRRNWPALPDGWVVKRTLAGQLGLLALAALLLWAPVRSIMRTPARN